MLDKPPFEILLVEDEPVDAHLVKLALKEGRLECRLHHVADGIEALAYLRDPRQGGVVVALPDLILLDLNMPRMNGREFLAAVKGDPPLAGIPVVVLTTSAVERDVVSAYQLGAAGYVTKPADMQVFFDSIHQLCSYWFTLARLPK
ncbi:MAG: response regulator [Proteobacteria bacterium]|nr:response regulator [Pseudomonadota bacterium]